MYAEYKRDVSHNYLILHGEGEINTASYQVRMLTGNTMTSVLRCRMQGLDGKWLFYYDITSKQSIASFYEQRKLQYEDLRMILGGFVRVMEELAEFLLNTEQLVLCPEYMFLDIEKREVGFCCLPDYHHPVQEQFRELTEYFLPKLDHEDQAAVNLGYGVYRKAMEQGLQLEHIKELLYKNENNKETVSDNNRDQNVDLGVVNGITDIPKQDSSMQTDDGEISLQKAENEKHKSSRWVSISACIVGVLILLAILAASYLGYLPEIPVEVVLGAAIVLMGICAGCSWIMEKKKKKEAQSAQWRNKVQQELSRSDARTKNKTEIGIENKTETRPENKTGPGTEYRTVNAPEIHPNQLYGETVVLSAGQLSGPASLVSREPGELAPVYLEKDLTVIGKLEQAADAVISLPTVSRVHARIRKDGEKYYLADLNSRNGTAVNGRMLGPGEEYLLQDEDQVDFAQARYVFLDNR